MRMLVSIFVFSNEAKKPRRSRAAQAHILARGGRVCELLHMGVGEEHTHTRLHRS